MAPTSSPSSTRCNMRSTTPFVACWKRASRSAITAKKPSKKYLPLAGPLENARSPDMTHADAP